MTKILSQVKQYWLGFPKALKAFLVKAVLLIIIWKMAYFLVLKPYRILDKPLTNATTVCTIAFMQKFYPNSTFSWFGSNPETKKDQYATAIIKDNRRVLGIADPCNGLELHILYLGFLVCLPTNWKRLLAFAAAGVVLIFILNVLRCSAMMQLSIEDSKFFDFAHHYFFKLIVYAAIFGGWVWYSKKLSYEK